MNLCEITSKISEVRVWISSVTHLQLTLLMFASKLVIKTKDKMKTISIKNIKVNTVKLNNKALQSAEKVVLTSIDQIE